MQGTLQLSGKEDPNVKERAAGDAVMPRPELDELASRMLSGHSKYDPELVKHFCYLQGRFELVKYAPCGGWAYLNLWHATCVPQGLNRSGNCGPN